MTTGPTGTTGTNLLNIKLTGPTGIADPLSSIFNKANLMLLFWFLAIYIIGYLFVGIIFKRGTSHYIDAIIFVVLFTVGVATVYSMSEQDQETMIGQFFTYIMDYLNQPSSIVSVGIFIVVFYIVVYISGTQMTEDSKSVFISLIENIAWITFFILLVVEFFKVFFHISLIDLLLGNMANIVDEIWDKIPDALPDHTGSIEHAPTVQKNEVFNVDNNLYTYDDAQAICSSYDARLATYDDVEKSYNEGGEWCNYGWSANQMALFPTQKSTWNDLQNTTDHKHDCGRPGINGGYIANPYVKFGVNCFGKKPEPTQADLDKMNAANLYPPSPDDVALKDNIAKWKASTLHINSFNHNQWRE